jgi:hypothetical protein
VRTMHTDWNMVREIDAESGRRSLRVLTPAEEERLMGMPTGCVKTKF